ncbi:mannosyltransferase [Trametes elegans]|nr:mannosyltransferase [Trametes elegans]
MSGHKLRIAFIHPDLGIGGAERLVVDAALGLQKLGHSVDIYTSHHDPGHCFDETRDGTLRVHHVVSPFPRAVKGKLHIVCAHARQLHLTWHLLRSAPAYDVYIVDQLSTCIPFLRRGAHTRVLFYCHFPDKLLAAGAYVDGKSAPNDGFLKSIYRYPMDWVEETTTKQADTILVNSRFTARVFEKHFPSIHTTPRVVYPGINLEAYTGLRIDRNDPDVAKVLSPRPTVVSLNRFEQKKNINLALDAFGLFRTITQDWVGARKPRLVLAGGYDPRLLDNEKTLRSLLESATYRKLPFAVITPSSSTVPLPSFLSEFEPSPDVQNVEVLFILNFSAAQRTALLTFPTTLALLYTPGNEHFGIVPVEAMACGLPVIACNSGGPTESVIDTPPDARTGWLRRPGPGVWADAIVKIMNMPVKERKQLGERAKKRAREVFSMDTMARTLEDELMRTVAMGPVPGSRAFWTKLMLYPVLLFAFIVYLLLWIFWVMW